MKSELWTYNMDTACVEARCPDGTLIAIDTLAVEREYVETWLDRRELDYLIYVSVGSSQPFFVGSNEPISVGKLGASL